MERVPLKIDDQQCFGDWILRDLHSLDNIVADLFEGQLSSMGKAYDVYSDVYELTYVNA